MKKLAILSLSVGFVSFVHAEAQAACGTLEVAKGDVKIVSAGKASPAAKGSKICSGDTIVAGVDSRAKIVMEDGNELNVSPDSKIVLETYQFNREDNKKKVLLNVLKGKVRAATKEENMYNDKAKDGQANTFQVRTKSAVAGVRGTDFLTGYDPTTNKSELITFRGKVEFGQPAANGGIVNSVQVSAGQKTEAVAGQAPAMPTVVPKAELDKANTETKSEGNSAAPGASGNSGPAKSDDKKADEKKGPETEKQAATDGRTGDDKKSADQPASEPRADDKRPTNDGKQAGENKQPSASGDGQANGNSNANSNGNSSGNNAGNGERRGDPQQANGRAGGGSGATAGAAPASGSRTSTGGPNTTGAGATTPSMGSPTLTGSRLPSSMPSGTMLDSGDLGGGAGFKPPVLPSLPGSTIPIIPLPTTQLPTLPTCTFCDSTIQNGGPSRVNIKIDIAN